MLIHCQWKVEMEEVEMLAKGKSIYMKLQKQIIDQMVMTSRT